ncbi:hypothetical protein LTR08_000672 [Meristemomyces frigidus]|nr:hypothetical protein LTR08_000672 [Meristemomyces frigidus]
MVGAEWEGSRDRDAWHQHSSSEGGRQSVPMWDSSDPDRAPPPLPIPPGVGSPTTKANTSAGIAAAAKLIVENARNTAPLSSYTSNQTPQGSPERSLIKGAHHKRMQSLQTGNVRDLRSYLDGSRSPERSPERPASRSGLSSYSRQQSTEDIYSPSEHYQTPTPPSRDRLKDTPSLRPSTRNLPRPLFDENSPPSSAGTLTIHAMPLPEPPLSDITNGPSTPSAGRGNMNHDFSSQLLHITKIATDLQKEMMGLSRRSKDNAGDLISLKEATNQRDEDIRKSLRELADAVGTQGLLPPPPPGGRNRSNSSYGNNYLDSTAYNSPPSVSKSWTLPRAASAHSFIDSPSPYSVEGAASVAMLEKIIREMVTKDGQERLLSSLSELQTKVGAASGTIHEPSSAGVKSVESIAKDDLVLLEEMIREVQANVITLAPKEGQEKLLRSLSELQTKVEAVDATIQETSTDHHPAEGVAMKDDLVLLGEMVRGVQANIASLAANGSQESLLSSLSDLQLKVEAVHTTLQDSFLHQRPVEGTAMKEDLVQLAATIQDSLLSQKPAEGTAMKDDLMQLGATIQDSMFSQKPTEGMAMKDDLVQLGATIQDSLTYSMTSQKPVEGIAMKDDLAQLGDMINQLQEDIGVLMAREPPLAPKNRDVDWSENPHAIELSKTRDLDVDQEPAEDSATKNNLLLLGDMLKEVAENVAMLAAREPASFPDDIARTENTDAIGNLLQDTKARLEELVLPEGIAMKDDLMQLGDMIKEVQESLATLAAREPDIAANEGALQLSDARHEESVLPEGVATKDDLELLGAMIKELQDNIVSLAAREPGPIDVARTENTDAIESLLQDTKARLEQLALPEGMAMKEDLASLEAMIKELQNSNVLANASDDVVLARIDNTDAIETLLHEISARLEGLVLPDPATAVSREQIDVVEASVRTTNEAIDGLVDRLENATAAKADVALVEVLAQGVKTALEEMQATKARLEELVAPDPATAVTKEHIDAVEAGVRITNEAIDSVLEKLELTTASKADVAVVEVLAQDVKTALEEMREKMGASLSEEERPEVMTKGDLDSLGVLCTEIKIRVDEMTMPDPEVMPTKMDIEQLTGLINDFRESHDKLRDSYETDIGVTAKAFDDRKQEFDSTVEHITSVKEALADIKDELLAKLAEGESGIDTLGVTLKTLEERGSDHEPVIAEVKEVMEAMNREFERTHGSLEAMKMDHSQSAETAFEKQAEHKNAMVAELNEKLDGLFDGLMVKYDDAQQAAEEKARAMEEQATAQPELLERTIAMTDELRLSIDTLGATMTTFATTFPEQMDKLTEESKTVFTNVEEMHGKLDVAQEGMTDVHGKLDVAHEGMTDVHGKLDLSQEAMNEIHNKLDVSLEGMKYEHSVTREEVVNVMTAVGAMQGDLEDHNPRFLMTLKEIQALIGQHYAHTQGATDAAAEHHQAVRDLQEQLKTGFEETKARHEAQTEELKTALPALLPPPPEVIVQAPAEIEKYDDTVLNEKLDRLMGHAEDAANPSSQIERLDQIHERVLATAAEVSAFVAAQAKQITGHHDTKEKEAEELALLLERRLVQKDEIESDITVLNEEKDTLRQAVQALKDEKEALAAQKVRLSVDVSSLETALHIRRDELHEMDRKAETIERRMLEGVMNQSRMLLLARTAKPAPKKKPQGRDLRVPSNASAVSTSTVTSKSPVLKANHALAMKTRPGFQRNAPNTAERRIMSLNQISHNVPTAVHAYPITAPSLISSAGSQPVKRSHSVKTQPMRKASWSGKRNLSLSAQNKENDILSEESEDELARDEPRSMVDDGDYGSEIATERRKSYATGTESGLTYGEGSYADDATPGTDDGRRTSYGTSDLSYGTGSYMTGSEVDRRTSLGSATGVLGVQSSLDEEPQEEIAAAAEQQGEPMQVEVDGEMKPHRFAPPSDSGLGTDLPTAAFSSTDSEYFHDRV